MSPKSLRLRGVLATVSGLLSVCLSALPLIPTQEVWAEPASPPAQEGRLSTQAGDPPVVVFNQSREKFAAASAGADSQTVQRNQKVAADIERLFSEGLLSYQKEDYAASLKCFNQVLALDGTHKAALKYQKLAQKELSHQEQLKSEAKANAQPPASQQAPTPQLNENEIKAEAAFERGMALYREKDYQAANKQFSESLTLNPEFAKAKTYLEKTDKILADQKGKEAQLAQETTRQQTEQAQKAEADKREQEIASLNEQARQQLDAGNTTAAKESFARVLEKDPGNRTAKSGLKKADSLATKQAQLADDQARQKDAELAKAEQKKAELAAKEKQKAEELAKAEQEKAELAAKEKQKAEELAKAELAAKEKQKAEELAKAEQKKAELAAQEKQKAEELAKAEQKKAELAAKEKQKAEELAKAEQEKAELAAKEKQKAEELAKAEQEKAELAAKEKQKAEQERAELAAKEKQKAEELAKAEQEKAELAAKEKQKAEQERAELAAKEKQKAEELAKAEQEKAELAAKEKQKAEELAKAEQEKAELAAKEKQKAEQGKAELAAKEKQKAEELAKAEQGKAELAAKEKQKAEELAKAEQEKAESAAKEKQKAEELAKAEQEKAELAAKEKQKAEELARAEQKKVETRMETKTRKEFVSRTLRETKTLLSAGRYDEAVSKLTDASKQYPDEESLSEALTKSQSQRELAVKQQEESFRLSEAERAKSEQKAKSEAVAKLIDEGKSNLKSEQFEDAIVKFQEALEIQPDNSTASSLLAKTESSRDASLKTVEESLKAKETQQTQQASVQNEQLKKEQAAQKFDEGMDLYRQGQYSQAQTAFAATLESDPQNKKAQRYLELSKASEENERVLLTQRQEQSEQERQQREAQDRQAALDKEYEDGMAAFKGKDYEAAISRFEKVLAQKADHAGATRSLAKARAAQEEEQKAQAAATNAEAPLVVAQADTTNNPEPASQAAPVKVVEEAPKTDSAIPQAPAPAVAEVTPSAPDLAKPQIPKEVRDEQIKQHLVLGKTYLEAKLYEQSLRELKAARELDPTNIDAATLLTQAQTAFDTQKKAIEIKTVELSAADKEKNKIRALEAMQKGRELYNQGDVINAVTQFQDAIALDSGNKEALDFIELTKDAYNSALTASKMTYDEKVKEDSYQKNLKTIVPAIDFNGSLITEALTVLASISAFNIVVSDGVEGSITLHITNKTVEETLDLILKPNGFRWERQGADVIVKPDFKTKIFQLSADDYRKIESILYDPNNLTDPSKSLQELLYPGVRKTNVPGRDIHLNPRTLQFFVTDTSDNIAKVEEFLKNIPELSRMAEPLVTKLFSLHPDIAKDIYDIAELMLYEGQKPQQRATGEEGRQLLLEKETNVLIVKDTEANIVKVQELLNDQGLTDRLKREELSAKRFTVSQEKAMDDNASIRRQTEVTAMEELLRDMLYTTAGLEKALAEGRKMMPNPLLGTIDIVDTPDNLKKVERFLASVKGEQQDMRIFPVKHADVQVLTDRLNLFAGRRIQGQQQDYDEGNERQQRIQAKIIPVPESHMIVVRASGPALDMFTSLVEMLDTEPEQVEIETRLIEVDLKDLQQMGIDWSLSNIGEEGLHVGRHDGAERSNLDLNMVDGLIPDGAQLGFQILGESELRTMLTMISRSDSAEILSAPKVVTLSSPVTPARIDISTAIPYITDSQVDTHGTDTPVDDTTRYTYATQDVGITMEVNPIVSGDGSIIMNVNPVVSSLVGRLPVATGNAQGSTPELGQPIIDTRTAVTRVRVGDGDTIVIGGLLRNESTGKESRVPFLSKIPRIGGLFKDTSEETRKKSLLIFVTARLIKGD